MVLDYNIISMYLEDATKIMIGEYDVAGKVQEEAARNFKTNEKAYKRGIISETEYETMKFLILYELTKHFYSLDLPYLESRKEVK